MCGFPGVSSAELPAEFPSQVLKIEIVLASVFYHVGVRNQAHSFLHCPWRGINLRVIDRNLNFQVPEVGPPKTFGNMESFRRRLSCLIQPCLSVEPASVHDQRVAFPL